MITPELKDHVLNVVVEKGPDMMFATIEIEDIFDVKPEIAVMLFRHFEKRGLILLEESMGSFRIVVHVESHDLLSHGGFMGEEELLKKNIDKLLYEIDSLKKSIPEKAASLSAIASAIFTGLSLFR